MSKEVVLTGLRSNAEYHLGNYLGGIQPMVDLQKKHAGQYQLNMFLPDLHSFTTPIDHGNLYNQTIQNLKVFVAAGLDTDEPNTFIYRQSYIPAHSELTWILSCFSYTGELNRMTQYKEKSQAQPDKAAGDKIVGGASAGLYFYPVLMAADILLYGAKWVPVGEDQRQHVEFARDLAIRLNNRFGVLFTVPEANAKQTEFAGHSEPVRIRSLRNPERKMSKSVEDPAGTIMLSDNPQEAADKVMSATTDSVGTIQFDWQKQPGITNLLQIYALLRGEDQAAVNANWQSKSSYGELKTAVAREVEQFLTKLQAAISSVDDAKLMDKLKADETAMSEAAEATLLKVQKAVGLRPA